MINRVVLVGRLTKDPEIRMTPNGVSVTRFTLAVNRPFTNQQGQRDADFINVVVWRRQAENAANYLKKGSLAGVDGRLQTSSFEGQDGKRVYMTEVIADSVQFLDPKNSSFAGRNYDERSHTSTPHDARNQPNPSSFQDLKKKELVPKEGPIDITDDDLPF